MRIATLNLWHGLAPGIGYTFHSLEPTFRRRQREILQSEWVAALNADILLLQEANPVIERAAELSKASGRLSFFQPDLTGIKFKGIGWPYNLNSGLVTLTHPTLGARSLGGLQLSGPRGWTKSWTSLQLSECRFALLVEFAHREWGRGLIVNVHLHHGLEFELSLRERVQKLAEDGSITSAAFGDLRSRLEEADQRRDGEIERLLGRLEDVKNRYGFLLIGGDLNCTPASAVYQRLARFGLTDLWSAGGKSEAEGTTFDSVRNLASHRFSGQYPITVESEDLSFSPKTRDILKSILLTHEARPRRIDYLWAMAGGRGLKVKEARLSGVPNDDELALSDHFALVVDLE